ncbi:MAG: sulfotransferase [Verrucomicrobia bacterium]|nr:MAG: sulfotransferase [Verrucomicrobiota bacterium]
MFPTRRRKIERLDFILAGAQKSGTTALHYFLSRHPEITMGDRQEMHFFDNEEIFSQPVDYELLHQHFPPMPASTIAGECTPIYIYWKPAIERIWKYNPKIKLLIILRNPVDRAFAHWNMQRFKGREPLDFLDAAKEEKNRTKEAAPLQARRYSYVDRGFYAGQLERVFKFFPREQVKIIKFEEFQDKKSETLDAIVRFLNVKPVVSSGDKDRNIVPYEREMTHQERKVLYGIFAEDIAKLEHMLGWDCTDWKAEI